MTATTIKLADPGSQDSLACIKHYYAELQNLFQNGFNPDLTVSASPAELSPPAGYFFLAYVDNKIAGCGGLKIHHDYAEIKRMWVNPKLRGYGIGKHLLMALEQQALEAHSKLIRLDTNKHLLSAIKLYKKSGYQEIKAYNDNPYADFWFEKHIEPR